MALMDRRTIEIPIEGMDCADCTAHVSRAVSALPGVRSVTVLLSSEKAIVELDPARVDLAAIRAAVEAAGYRVPSTEAAAAGPARRGIDPRVLLRLFGAVFGAVLFVVVVGEWLGLFEVFTRRIPWPVWVILIVAGGWPIFRNVALATRRRQIISHTLMTVGTLAAVAVGEWATAAVVVFFMRMGDYTERFTTEHARQALKDLNALAPQTARVERDGTEVVVRADEVAPGDVIIVRPGEQIPVDGDVVSGQATIDQAAITGESMPVEVGPGASVFAATLNRTGALRLRATRVGADSTFGRVVRLVADAERNRAEVQRIADRFSAYYLPVVSAIAALTFLVRRDPLATAAVLVVACSCSFALATPIAFLASVGAGAKRGVLIKGGKYLESLARADVLLLDKTGTLTLGRPQITDVVPRNGASQADVLFLAASAERYSEHPLAEAVRAAAQERGLTLADPEQFEAVPGFGVRTRIGGQTVVVGRADVSRDGGSDVTAQLEGEGKTVFMVVRDDTPVGLLAAADTPRSDAPRAIEEIRRLGVRDIELLTGDNAQTAAALADLLGIRYRAGLLPEDKIAVVKAYQEQGRVVVMVGDGINDAPALAQAHVGIAMGAAGTDIAIEAAHIALMREDWMLVPQLFRIARRTMRVVRANIAFTALYNLAGLSLAAVGLLPPILAAGAQSLPDLGILANSSRLLRQR